jgi:hypothetical protein
LAIGLAELQVETSRGIALPGAPPACGDTATLAENGIAAITARQAKVLAFLVNFGMDLSMGPRSRKASKRMSLIFLRTSIERK